ncbi:peptidoglycan-associated lipoprotein Pal [Desulfurivibrio alkaliphilus]|uniref:Peptidoglycan-associated lipoprotein n=1 Tax=Desulfurivibrio alkaliphilus (strain DSM 19089 / UNIQEM U267 / AHT2) TaxID=589865 RepID=D6Z2F8_DESAT|nr:peptidoglycan-associated lipoprotein Pal [Desulfurivibrio alkaliphilus]ADH85733.1 peptidoglycan-associated lipoprotein [Desulfurivibrio alkaliphilus AHT 2]
MKKEIKRIFTAVAIVCAVSLFAAGCGKRVAVDPADEPTMEPAVTETKPTHTPWEPAHAWPGEADEESLDDTAAAELAVKEGRTSGPLMPVYYDFDRSNIRADQEERLVHNSNYMLDNPRVRVRIEGNTDERGTREYNMALGERRALSAKKYLIDLGVAAERLETLSYGEERPISFGRDELSWSLNRRSDFVIIR